MLIHADPTDVVLQAPPNDPKEEAPAPREGFVWIHGYWQNLNGAWYWEPGRWESARPGYAWRDGHWERVGQTYQWVAGGWEISR